jgi:hypothetical protein
MALERRGKPAFNSNPDTGRMGYRTEVEAADERPLLYSPHPFWTDETERMTYEAAVEADPIKETDYRLAYVARISASVEGKYQRVGSMPHVRMSRVERDRQLAKLRGQVPKGTEVI